MKEALSKEGIKFASADISSGMLPLKKFLVYRDSRPEFDEIKAQGRVGLPCIVVDDGANPDCQDIFYHSNLF